MIMLINQYELLQVCMPVVLTNKLFGSYNMLKRIVKLFLFLNNIIVTTQNYQVSFLQYK